jgi:hypothetical protein
MLAKDCMESSKGAARFRIKNEMASRDFDLVTRKKGESPDWK